MAVQFKDAEVGVVGFEGFFDDLAEDFPKVLVKDGDALAVIILEELKFF